MLKLLKKKSVIAAVFITGAVVLVFVLMGSNNFAVSAVKTVFSPVLSLTAGVADKVGDFKDYLIEMQIYREENERLTEQLNTLNQSNRDIAELKAENERLNRLLDLKSSLKYASVGARVVSYEPNNWYDTLVINKGTNNGVKIGAAVISSGGIVGKVTDAGIGWARVSSLLNDETAVGVRIIRTGELAVVEGDSALSSQKYCKLSFFDGTLSAGDALETTGEAGVYPEGIMVGTVMKVENEEYAVVEPAVDFGDLYEVLVITGIAEE